ncbi:hypothetical protein [Vibrio mediterranei]|uniref:hypothetical protein n=1 Tax=Vibrio mediterranei TaxID=689 RepID=UPI0040691ABF
MSKQDPLEVTNQELIDWYNQSETVDYNAIASQQSSLESIASTANTAGADWLIQVGADLQLEAILIAFSNNPDALIAVIAAAIFRGKIADGLSSVKDMVENAASRAAMLDREDAEEDQ